MPLRPTLPGMTDSAHKAPNAKVRDDDNRGTPPGQGTIVPAHGGRIGNPSFEPTDEQRQQARELAKVFPPQGERFIARLMGIDRMTLRKYFGDDLELGRAQMLAAVGSQLILGALNAGNPTAKGDRDLQKFVMARLGGWSNKTDMAIRQGDGEDENENELVDLSLLTEEEFAEYGRLAAKAQGIDPDLLLATPLR